MLRVDIIIQFKIHNQIILEISVIVQTDVASRDVFNNRVCELTEYAINKVIVYTSSVCRIES